MLYCRDCIHLLTGQDICEDLTCAVDGNTVQTLDGACCDYCPRLQRINGEVFGVKLIKINVNTAYTKLVKEKTKFNEIESSEGTN